jgi:hypothetical protein
MWNDDLALCLQFCAHIARLADQCFVVVTTLAAYMHTLARVCALLYARTLLAGFPLVHNCIDRNLGVAFVTEIYQYVILLDPFFSSKLMDSTSDRVPDGIRESAI